MMLANYTTIEEEEERSAHMQASLLVERQFNHV
jgi:hypothetical protein